MPKMQNSKQKATAILPAVEKYTFRGEDSDSNLAGQLLHKKDTVHIDDDEEVSLITTMSGLFAHKYCHLTHCMWPHNIIAFNPERIHKSIPLEMEKFNITQSGFLLNDNPNNWHYDSSPRQFEFN